MSLPLVSVIVATYRRAEPLRNALASLAEQSYCPLEIVLVDDNAHPEWNQRVSEIVRQFRMRDPGAELTYIANTENLGSARTRNVGIGAASGSYVTFLDDDDVYLPNKIDRQIRAMMETAADYSITDLMLYSEDGHLTERRVRDYVTDTDRASLLRGHLMYHMTGTDTLMFKKSYLLEIGGFPPIDVGDEFYLMCSAIAGGGRFCYLPGCDVRAYVHTGEGGLSSGAGKIAGEHALYQYKKTYFAELDARSRRYIRMRHYAVLAYVGMRSRRYGAFVLNGARAFLSAPAACFRLGWKRCADRTAAEPEKGDGSDSRDVRKASAE